MTVSNPCNIKLRRSSIGFTVERLADDGSPIAIHAGLDFVAAFERVRDWARDMDTTYRALKEANEHPAVMS